MVSVEPIRDIKLIKDIYEYLKNKCYRDFILIFLGFNTGLRISDLLKLKVHDVKDTTHIYIREKKTNKERKIPLFAHVKRELYKYIAVEKITDDLFPARYTGNNISRHRAWEIIKNVERKFKLKNLGTHTLRKTFGYNFYKQTKDIAVLMKILNHHNQLTTLEYIGVTQDMINKRMKEFKL